MNLVRRAITVKRERGAVAVVVAIVMVMLMAAAALGMDIAKLAYERQALRAAIDAASQAGSFALPDVTTATADAKAFALASAPDLNLNPAQVQVQTYCAIAVKSGTNNPDENQVPSICNPGTAWAKGQPAAGCNGTICVLPCSGTGAACNTIKVSYDKTVAFAFAPVIGIPSWPTGAISSASCKGMCGALAPNPLDVVVVADRTPSMNNGTSAFANMKQSLKDMLLTMNRDQQYVALGTLAKSTPTGTCLTQEPSSSTFSGKAFSSATGKVTGQTWSWADKKWTFNGAWVPADFSNNYTTGNQADGTLVVNTASALYKAINCLDYSDSTVSYPKASDGTSTSTNEGTHLASAMKGATKYLLDSSHLSGMPSREEYGTPKKVIIFETDGAPSELFNSHSDALLLGNDYDIGYTGGADVGNGKYQSCANLMTMAQKAKDAGIKIITIGVGDVNTATCGTYSGSTVYVRDVLAKSASPKASGSASDAIDCTTAGNTSKENSDGDSYFCAASAGDLSSIFAAAVASITGNTKFIRVPGISD
jgi:hypothetical protein